MNFLIRLSVVASSFIVLTSCAMTEPKRTLTGDYLAGRLAARVNAIDDAAKAYGNAVNQAPREQAVIRDAFFFHLAAGEVDKARPYALALATPGASDPDDLARFTLAIAAIRDGNLRDAKAKLSAEFKEPFIKSLAFLVNIWIEADLDSPEKAIEKLDAAGDEIFKGFSATHKALLADKAGNTSLARENFQLSLYSLAGPVGRTAFGAFLERSESKEHAREFYSALQKEVGPSRRAAEQAFARIESSAPNTLYQNTSTREGAAIATYSFAGLILEQIANERNRATKAGFTVGSPRFNLPLALAQLALYLDPELVEARRLIGTTLVIYENYDAANKILKPISKTSPYYEQSRIDMATGLARQNKNKAAIQLLKSTIKDDPNAAESRLTLGTLLALEEEYDSAVGMFSDAIKLIGNSPETDIWRYYVARGEALIKLQRWSEAEDDLKKALEIAPEEPTVLNYLGYSWAERGVNLDKAFALIEKAININPTSGAIIDSLGWAHFQLGDFQEAVLHLEKAAKLVPEDPTITDHLGDVYWRLNRQTEAQYQWQRALELEPTERMKTNLIKKLKSGLTDTDNTDTIKK